MVRWLRKPESAKTRKPGPTLNNVRLFVIERPYVRAAAKRNRRRPVKIHCVRNNRSSTNKRIVIGHAPPVNAVPQNAWLNPKLIPPSVPQINRPHACCLCGKLAKTLPNSLDPTNETIKAISPSQMAAAAAEETATRHAILENGSNRVKTHA